MKALLLPKLALFDAAKRGDTELLEAMLQRGGLDIEERDEYHETALHWACYRGHPEVVRMLLAAGANPNSLAQRNVTPLLLNAEHGSVEVFRALTSAVPSSSSSSPSTTAVAAVDLLARDQEGRTCLHRASELGHLELCREILRATTSPPSSEQQQQQQRKTSPLVNAATNRGNTSLVMAAASGNVEVVNLLLLNGANTFIARSNGWTALHRAVEGNHINVVRMLLEWGANVHSPNSVGTTPLHLAAQEASEDDNAVLELLLSYGARPWSRQNGGKLPIHLAENDVTRGILNEAGGKPPQLPTLVKLCVRTLLIHQRYDDLVQLSGEGLLENIGIRDPLRPFCPPIPVV